MSKVQISYSKIDASLKFLAKRICPFPDLVADVTQEIRFHIWKAIEEFPGNTANWYLKRAEWHGRAYLQKIHAYEPHEELTDEHFEVIQTEALNEDLDYVILDSTLTASQHTILKLFHEGYGVMEISKLLGVNHSVISRQLKRIESAAEKLAQA